MTHCRTVALTVILLTVSMFTFAQDKPPEECPTISVIEPQGIANVGEKVEFELNPEISRLTGLQIAWSVTSGTIEKGQGTRAITVRTADVNIKETYETFTATASIKGLPKECNSAAKGEAVLYQHQGDILVDEWGRIRLNDQRARLDSFVIELINNPTDVGYVVLAYTTARSKSELPKRAEFIRRHIHGFRKLPRNRVVILSEPFDRETTKIYRLPPDANFCSTCKVH